MSAILFVDLSLSTSLSLPLLAHSVSLLYSFWIKKYVKNYTWNDKITLKFLLIIITEK